MSSDVLLEDFRLDLREWIQRNRPEGLENLVDWNGSHGGGARRERIAHAMDDPRYKQWEEHLKEARLICPQWPEDVGGRGFSAPQLAVFSEELNHSGLPRVHRGMGEGLVGPSLIVHGDDWQRNQFLPRIITNEDIYCQGFSEPGHGSDLAGVETKGEIDGDEIVITGQKVWTSGATEANMIFVLCRTGPDLPKHSGLTYVLVPIADNGFTIRPIRQISGASGFCEVFIDGARAPIQNIVGGLNNGWRVAMTTLSNERGAGATVQHLPYEREFWHLVSIAKERGLTGDPLLRQKLAWAFSHVQIMRFSGLRTMDALRANREPPIGTLAGKLFWSEYNKRFGETALDMLGADALIRPSDDEYALSSWQELFLHSRAGTIFAGTSEIQRNVISERGLGLPKS
ncbi:MAG: acyl-CoA dehydrogenase family protein [Acidimicrobiales bacterium]